MAQAVDPPKFLGDFWDMFGTDTNFVEIECDESNDLINDILTTYGIQGDSTTNLGGSLKNLDIKHMDALTVINLSLLEGSSAVGNILEWIVNEEGQFEIIEIGHNDGNLTPVYYELQSGTYKEPCVGVMITGAKPLINPKDLLWKYIWGDQLDKHVYHTTDVVTNCAKEDFSTNAIIVYNDPHLDSKYVDGIDNFYEITTQNPWDRIVGYVRAISVPGYDPNTDLKDTDIKEHPTSILPITVTGVKGVEGSANLGNLVERPSAPDDPTTETDNNCWSSQPGKIIGDYTDGVKIELPDDLFFIDVRGIKISKYIRVEAVYIVGRKFDFLQSIPANPQSTRKAPSVDNSVLVGSIKDIVPGTYKLDEGTHYVITYDPGDKFKNPYILFAKNSRPNEPHIFGTDQEYHLMPGCQLAQTSFGEGKHKGSILPVAETKGFLVDQVLAMVHVDTPSISVYDPEWNDDDTKPSKALDIAKALEYKMAAIVLEEKPAPIAFCAGSRAVILDQSASKVDSDFTTKQNFTDTPLEEAMDIMASGPGVSLSLTFIEEEDDLKDLAETLFDYMNSSENTSIETTYICGPEASPKLGAEGENGGIINSVSYTYTDSGSYTISVTEGPWMINAPTSVNTSASLKMTETVSARGTVIDTLDNNIFFKVHIDGYGDRVAINTAADIIRKDDVVSCTIHNNPVEA